MSKEEGLNYFGFAALNFYPILEGSVNPELHSSGQKKLVECNFQRDFSLTVTVCKPPGMLLLSVLIP